MQSLCGGFFLECRDIELRLGQDGYLPCCWIWAESSLAGRLDLNEGNEGESAVQVGSDTVLD